ncbi:MAG: sugar O-acetyltransferase [Nitratireductor sp.]
MTSSERERMGSGDWYRCVDPELDDLRAAARAAVHAHNTAHPAVRGALAPALGALFGRLGDDVLIEAPFHCAYGFNLFVGDRVYFNTGCVILDTAPVTIGAGTMFGPSVHIYCADHHRDPVLRGQGLERALPVRIGSDVWVGGGAIIPPGVAIGDGAIVGAGAVVTRDVATGATVAGNPARPR